MIKLHYKSFIFYKNNNFMSITKQTNTIYFKLTELYSDVSLIWNLSNV